MSEDNRSTKVEILIKQNKYEEAEKILAELLNEDPNNVHFLYLLAEVNLQQDQFDKAESIINYAIGLSPEIPYLFYLKSRIEIQKKKMDEAESSIKEAINLDPNDADYFALYASIKLMRKKYSEALEISNQALEIDPENTTALNIRTSALIKLDRTEESFNTIEGALKGDPNNALTHTNYGWILLEKGNHKKALEHFKEALAIDPNFSNAHAGILESLKAKNPFYRVFLKYSFWIGNLTSKYQWAVIIGFYLVIRLLRTLATNNEKLQPYLTPIVIILSLIAFSTWIITPVSNLFLRFNKYGKLLLSKKEKLSSSFVAISLLTFIVGLLLYIIASNEKFLAIAVFGFAMMLPLSVMFSASKYKNSLLIYSIVMILIGLSAIGLTFSKGELFNRMSLLFVIGFVAFQWVANYLMIKEDNL
jgi:tetratricopeptide (TPR) repeat protein